MTSPNPLAAHITEFREEGVTILRGLFPKDIMQECLDGLAAFQAFEKPVAEKNLVFDEPSSDVKTIKFFQHINLYIPPFWKLYNVRLLEVANALLDQKTYFYSMGLHDKAPGIGTLTPMHQDNFYWCMTPPDAMTAYIALEPYNPSSGGITYVKRSHIQAVLPHEKSKVKAFSSFIEGYEGREEDLFRPSLDPGDVCFHHANVIHGAAANRSTSSRRAVAVGIYGEKARVSPEMKDRYEANRRYNRG